MNKCEMSDDESSPTLATGPCWVVFQYTAPGLTSFQRLVGVDGSTDTDPGLMLIKLNDLIIGGEGCSTTFSVTAKIGRLHLIYLFLSLFMSCHSIACISN